VRLAFELAVAEGRKKVHCATKANIMKLTEGLLKRTFEEIAPEYASQGIEAHHIIIDNLAHQLVRYPESYDVIVTTNMNGDIISDLTSGLTGGLGLAPSANIGNDAVMFEAVHGSAPPIAGKDIANPTAMLLSSVLMLRHLGEFDAARTIENAIWYTLEDGKVLTVDIIGDHDAASTTAFTDEIIKNLGHDAKAWTPRDYKPIKLPRLPERPDYVPRTEWRVVGVDVFIDSGLSPRELGDSLVRLAEGSALRLKMISNRGTKVYPETGGMTDCVDHWRCRFVLLDDAGELGDEGIYDLLQRVSAEHRWMHLEKLPMIGQEMGFTRAQGED
jgi:isocitrate dehydrogenase